MLKSRFGHFERMANGPLVSSVTPSADGVCERQRGPLIDGKPSQSHQIFIDIRNRLELYGYG